MCIRDRYLMERQQHQTLHIRRIKRQVHQVKKQPVSYTHLDVYKRQYNNCSHQEAYTETGMQGVSYTTGLPAMIGAMMFLKGLWKKPGVWNVEEFKPDPFLEQHSKQGLPWHEIIDGDLEV